MGKEWEARFALFSNQILFSLIPCSGSRALANTFGMSAACHSERSRELALSRVEWESLINREPALLRRQFGLATEHERIPRSQRRSGL